MRRRLPVSQWFYDNESYYNYVLVNCSEDVFHDIVSALENADIDVLKAASSFRPASNGYKYDWYIRIGGDPSYYDILPIVEGVLLSDSKRTSQKHTEARPTTTNLQLKISQLQGQVKQKDQEISQLSNDLVQAKKLVLFLRAQLQSTQNNLDESRRQIEELNRQVVTFTSPSELKKIRERYKSRLNKKAEQLKSAQDELVRREAEIEKLNNAIINSYKPEDIEVLRSQYDHRLQEKDEQIQAMQIEIQKSGGEIERLNNWIQRLFKPEEVERLKKQYEQALKEKDDQISKSREELQQFLDQFEIREEEITEREQMIRDLKNQIAMLEQEKQDLEMEKEVISSESDGTNGEKDIGLIFNSIVKALLPDIKFMKGSLRYLWNELPDDVIIDVLSSLQSLDTLTAKRVGGADSWREYYRKNNKYPWRLYFRKCNQKKKCEDGKKYLVLISEKNLQKRDIKNRLD